MRLAGDEVMTEARHDVTRSVLFLFFLLFLLFVSSSDDSLFFGFLVVKISSAIVFFSSLFRGDTPLIIPAR